MQKAEQQPEQQVESTPTAPARTAAGYVKTLLIVALVVVNTALGLSLISGLAPDNSANAAASAQAARPSEYLMIPSRPVGLNQDVVYILDTENGWLSTAGYDQSTKTIRFTSPIGLD